MKALVLTINADHLLLEDCLLEGELEPTLLFVCDSNSMLGHSLVCNKISGIRAREMDMMTVSLSLSSTPH